MLADSGFHYRHVRCQSTFTSSDNDRVRRGRFANGGKALDLLVRQASCRVDWTCLVRPHSHRSVRFVSWDELLELLELTGLIFGRVAPFDRPFLELVLVVDVAVLFNERIALGAGSRTASPQMSTKDRVSVPRPFELLVIAVRSRTIEWTRWDSNPHAPRGRGF